MLIVYYININFILIELLKYRKDKNITKVFSKIINILQKLI